MHVCSTDKLRNPRPAIKHGTVADCFWLHRNLTGSEKNVPPCSGWDDIEIQRLQADPSMQRCFVCLPERKIHVPHHDDGIDLVVTQWTLPCMMNLVDQSRGVNGESFG
jgi:hypothetical protein